MSFPQDGMIFDEAYYIPAAVDLLEGRPSNIEHPFMGKLWGALGIAIFGNNWFGWRIFYVIISTSLLYVFYRLCKIFLDEKISIYCTTLLAFENMFFIHSSIVMLDIPSIFFGIAGVYFFLKKRIFLSAVLLGLSILNKETGVLFILVIIIYEFAKKHEVGAYRFKSAKTYLKPLIFISIILLVVLVPISIYDTIYRPTGHTVIDEKHTIIYDVSPEGITSTITKTDFQTINKPITNGIEHIYYILTYASSLTTENNSDINSGNFAWNWILPAPTPFQPAPYYVISENRTITTIVDGDPIKTTWEIVYPIAWYGVGNMPIWWTIWIIVPFGIILLILKRANNVDILTLSWIASTYLPMLYLSLVVHRIVYPFYFLYTIPILCISFPRMVNYVAGNSGMARYVLWTFLIVVLWIFFRYFPVNVFAQ
jgi:hypothetical protein